MRFSTAQVLTVLVALFLPSTQAALFKSANSDAHQAITVPAAKGAGLFAYLSSMATTGKAAQTPYELLGVSVTSTNDKIATAYKKKMEGFSLGGSRKQAIQQSYETLIDPYKRCIYHKESKTPDWYGVPWVCWGELALDRLGAAKVVINMWEARDESFTKMCAATQNLKARLTKKPVEEGKSTEKGPWRTWFRT
jgi:hypothetical protein